MKYFEFLLLILEKQKPCVTDICKFPILLVFKVNNYVYYFYFINIAEKFTYWFTLLYHLQLNKWLLIISISKFEVWIPFDILSPYKHLTRFFRIYFVICLHINAFINIYFSSIFINMQFILHAFPLCIIKRIRKSINLGL